MALPTLDWEARFANTDGYLFGEEPTYFLRDVTRLLPTQGVGDHNYGEGSSREHAAMEPRHLGVKVVIVKSFARIHETNLKKQGMLALTFDNESDYDLIQEDDTFNFVDLESFSPSNQITIELLHSDGSSDIIKTNHTYNSQQIDWYREGSALNLIKKGA